MTTLHIFPITLFPLLVHTSSSLVYFPILMWTLFPKLNKFQKANNPTFFLLVAHCHFQIIASHCSSKIIPSLMSLQSAYSTLCWTPTHSLLTLLPSLLYCSPLQHCRFLEGPSVPQTSDSHNKVAPQILNCPFNFIPWLMNIPTLKHTPNFTNLHYSLLKVFIQWYYKVIQSTM